MLGLIIVSYFCTHYSFKTKRKICKNSNKNLSDANEFHASLWPLDYTIFLITLSVSHTLDEHVHGQRHHSKWGTDHPPLSTTVGYMDRSWRVKCTSSN